MAYGFQSISSGGFVQIDDNYENFRVVQSGTGTTGTYVNFPAQTSFPIVMFRTVALNVFVTLVLPSNIEKARFNIGGTLGQSYYYAVLVPQAGAVSTNPYGLRILNTAGGCVFDSGLTYMELDNVTQMSHTTQQPAMRYLTYPAAPRGVRYLDANSLSFNSVYLSGYFNGIGYVATRYMPGLFFTGANTVSVTWGSNTYYYDGYLNYVNLYFGSVRPRISGYF